MESPSVSVIVPVYNCAPYVEQCLQSLKHQTLTDFEAIVVDDASEDDSMARVIATVGDDARFIVMPQKVNRGLSAVRNIGLDNARGEYVVFLDSDDYLREDALQLLVTRARDQKLDDLYFSGISFYDDPSLAAAFDEDFGQREEFEGVATGRELYVFFVERDQFFTSAALRMVRRKFIEEEAIRFREGILHEDILFTFQTLAASQRSSFLNQPLYMRRWRAGSIVTNRWTRSNINGHVTSMREIRRWMEEHADSLDYRFSRAVGTSLGKWQHLCAEKWASDLSEDEREEYLAELSPEERVAFCIDVLGSGGEAAAARQEFADSIAYRLGSAMVAVPRALRDRLNGMRRKREQRPAIMEKIKK